MRRVGHDRLLPAISAPLSEQTHDDCFRCHRLLLVTMAQEVPLDEWPALIVGKHPNGPICGRCAHELSGDEYFRIRFLVE